MSQITRCPACATQFKVVADQLRISEGWVRCGQCKEVFDASAHLVAAPPPPMLPDVSLTDTRPPPVVVAREPEARGAWGVFDPPAPRPSAAAPVVPGARAASPLPSSVPTPSLPALHPPVAGGGAVLPVAGDDFRIPAPTVPAFLSATRPPAAALSADEMSLEPLQTFGWRAPPVPPLAPSRSAPAVAPAAFVPPAPREESRVVPGLAASLLADLAPVARPPLPKGLDPAAQGVSVPAGYELPVADFSDSMPEDVDDYDDEGPDTEIMPLPHGLGDDDAYPALELPAQPARRGMPAVEEDDDHDDGVPLFGPSAVVLPPPPLAAQLAVPEPEPVRRPPPSPSPASAGAFSESQDPLPEVDFALMPDPGFSPSAQPGADSSVRGTPAPGALDDGEDGEPPEGPPEVEEVSFVRAARRKAFWRRPAVRAVLALVMLLLLGGLAVQVAVQERNRIAATDSRTRPWLQQLCAQLGCTLAPQRQIADVVIDSSSFNKARGDGYLLALTVKSRAAIPLEMPAVELTLTDAQDQPVLRRVLLPADLAAPAELAARGEWSASVSVAVTSGASRVSGYRVLTFYP